MERGRLCPIVRTRVDTADRRLWRTLTWSAIALDKYALNVTDGLNAALVEVAAIIDHAPELLVGRPDVRTLALLTDLMDEETNETRWMVRKSERSTKATTDLVSAIDERVPFPLWYGQGARPRTSSRCAFLPPPLLRRQPSTGVL